MATSAESAISQLRKYRGLIGVASIVAIGAYIWGHRGDLMTDTHVSAGPLILGFVGIAISMFANGWLNWVMLRKLGTAVSFAECLSLSILTSAGNLLGAMQGGAAIRAVYLKRVHGFGYTHFLATLFALYLLTIFVSSAGALLALAWMAFGQGRTGLGSVTVVATAGVVGCAIAAMLPRLPDSKNWLFDKLASASQGWYALKDEPRTFAHLIGIVFVQIASGILTLWACYAAIGLQLGLPEIVTISSLGSLATVLAITPGGLGFYEAAVAAVGSTVAIEPVQSVTASILSRGILLVVLLITAPVATYHLSGCTKKEPEEFDREGEAKPSPLPLRKSA